jgi:large subunit ribosomal protein L19
MDKTAQISKDLQTRKDLDMRAGDTVRVHVKIQEKGKTRIQMFEGLVISRKHGNEAGGTFAVRKISNGIGVERVFPLYSPIIDKIEVIKRSVMRRSKLYFVRTKVARVIRRKMRNLIQFFTSSADLVKPEEMMDEVVEETPVVTETVEEATPATQTEEVTEEKKEE